MYYKDMNSFNKPHPNWPHSIIDQGQKILDSLDFNCPITPQKNDVLNFLTIDPQSIKVVILGQDPYPTKGVANGYAFAVNSYAPIPKSLQNIFQEIKATFGKVITDRTLKHWTNQGVLLLNTSLTTLINQPNAHQSIWKDFTLNLIKWLDSNIKLIWVLWGNEAKKYLPLLHNQVIYDAHPSPLSVSYRKKHTFKELHKLTNISW